MRRESHAKYFYQNLYCSIATKNYKELITELYTETVYIHRLKDLIGLA
jgi:hypothetical protein